jgi:hypothetical protein
MNIYIIYTHNILQAPDARYIHTYIHTYMHIYIYILPVAGAYKRQQRHQPETDCQKLTCRAAQWDG